MSGRYLQGDQADAGAAVAAAEPAHVPRLSLTKQRTIAPRNQPRAEKLEIAECEALPPVGWQRVVLQLELGLPTDQNVAGIARLCHAEIRFEKHRCQRRLVAPFDEAPWNGRWPAESTPHPSLPP